MGCLANRLCDACKKFDSQVIISDAVAKRYQKKSSLILRQILVFQVEQKRSVFTNYSFRLNEVQIMVRLRRLELPRVLPHSDLNAARLPIPPQPHNQYHFQSGVRYDIFPKKAIRIY